MSDNSKIEWTDASWNPVTGCTKVSDGCTHCYIDRTPPFRMAGRRFDGDQTGATTGVRLHSDRLGIPQRWRKPRRIFVCSLADVFQDDVPDRFIAEVFAVMSIAEQHTYQVLTKRHARMRSLLSSERFWVLVDDARAVRRHGPLPGAGATALPNVWLGVSVENRQWADIRIPALRETPAAVRMLSCEPLLGPLDNLDLDGIGWVIAGGESGHGARPMHPDWARGLRDRCVAAGVPYFFKQHGEWAPIGPLYAQGDDEQEADDARMDAVAWEIEERREVVQLERTGHVVRDHQPGDPRTWLMVRAGKKAAGRVLDGRTWDEYPEARVMSG